MDAETFLRRINFPPAARHLAFEVFSRSFFAAPGQMSAAELAAMFHIYFLGSSEGLVFDVPDSGFDVALWEPLRGLPGRPRRRRTHRHRVPVDRRCRTGGGRDASRCTLEGGGQLDADAVVLATDVRGLQAIVGELARAWPTPAWRHAGRRPAHRAAVPGASGCGWTGRWPRTGPRSWPPAACDPLDNISVLDRYDRQARGWHQSHGGSVVELHAYAAPGDPGTPAGPCLLTGTVARLHALYPETAAARVLAESVLVAGGLPAVRRLVTSPAARGDATPFPGLVLAGDGIRIDLRVALMNTATEAAAGARPTACWPAGAWPGHDLYSVPTRGRLAPLRWLRRPGRGATATATDHNLDLDREPSLPQMPLSPP